MSNSAVLEHFDVAIIGAGISGIGAAVHLQKKSPDRNYVILEGRDSIGGTWDLFQYPGIRSDSDMYTLGYNFKPWREQKAIADGPSIMKYLQETVDEFGIAPHIRYHHQVKHARWSTPDQAWTLTLDVAGEQREISCSFLFLCGGYYRYSAGYTPDFPGRDRFQGTFIHPQHWPKDLDYAGKKVVVIGSGATAVTLVPAMADKAAHVTMLQRSPTYMAARPAEDALANKLREKLPPMLAYGLIRWRNILFGMYFFNRARKQPEKVANFLINQVREKLGPDYDVEKHFKPSYNPWDQRLCLVPDDDLFNVIRDGKASVVTDHIETFTENGIQLKSGEHLDADIIVSATGLTLEVFNGISVNVDGRDINPGETFGYRGMMYSDVPNMASSFGYTNASWTLKCDLTCDYVARVLNHMKETGTTQVTPRLHEQFEPVPWLDFSSGYVRRAMEKFPKQGPKKPWKLNQNYFLDLLSLRYSKLEDGTLEFTRRAANDDRPRVLEAAE